MSDELLCFDAAVYSRDRLRLEAKLEAPAGITVLFGPSGAGKSTCLEVIAGLLKPTRGRVQLGAQVLDDVDAKVHVPAHLRKIALVFQSLALFPHLSAEANVAFGLSRTLTSVERSQQAQAWLKRMHVEHLLGRRPATFSGGEAQRVALARALASSPRVLLLDEPFSALDSALRKKLRSEVQELVNELKLPTILVTHDEHEARALGQRSVFLEEGRVCEGSL